MNADVIVVGAGAAGLSAAARIAESGKSVILLEARNRIGGRIFSVEDASLKMPIELGAEFVHGLHPALLRAAQGIGIEKIEGEDCCSTPSGLRRCDFFEQVDALLGELEKQREDMSFAAFLRSIPQSAASEQTRQRALGYVEGFNAANAEEISIRSLVADRRAQEEIGGEESYRLRGGYASLLRQMHSRCDAAGVSICIGHDVRKVEWHGAIQIAGVHEGAEFRCTGKAAVITVPVPLLQQRAIDFGPPLPPEFCKALDGIATGHAVRINLVFRERLWSGLQTQQGRSLADLRFLFAVDRGDISHFPTFWTLGSEEAPVIVAWSPARLALQLQSQPRDAITSHALHDLSMAMGVERAEVDRHFVSAHFHLWESDVFARGAYTYLRVGALDAPEVLSRPLENRLFFAGDAIETTGNHSTVHGAIASGECAAERVLVES